MFLSVVQKQLITLDDPYSLCSMNEMKIAATIRYKRFRFFIIVIVPVCVF